MTLFWILLVALVLVIGFGIFLVFSGFFDQESPLYNKAEKKLEEGKTDDAKPLLKQAVSVDPDKTEARWELAKILQRERNYHKAAPHLEYCLENDEFPEGVGRDDALVRLAQIYEKGEMFEKAIDTWSRYLQFNTDSMEAHFRRGRIYFRENRLDQALRDFRAIEKNFDESPELLSLYIGRCLYRKENHQEAYEYYGDFMNSNPNNTQALMEMASLARKLDRDEEARELFSRLKKDGKLKEEAEALVQLSAMALDNGELDKAEEHMEELEEVKGQRGLPETLDLHRLYQKAQILQKRDQDDEALNLYRSIYEKRKNFLDVESIINEAVEQLDPEEIFERYHNADRETFLKITQEIVNLMGFEIIETNSFGPDEVNIKAREEADDSKVNRVLFTFKRWDNNVGEWPLREFELQILEDRFDRGIFVAPGGFQYSAKQYVQRSQIRLIGPDTLLQYLKEVEKKDL